MKYISSLILFFALLTGCGLFKSGPKIQKNSAFTPICTDISGVICSSGSPACGTKPGSGELLVYCIDGNDTILEAEACCPSGSENQECGSITPRCIEGVNPDKVQKSPGHFLRCSNDLGSPQCKSGNPVCGILPGAQDVVAICVDNYDIKLDERPSCPDGQFGNGLAVCRK